MERTEQVYRNTIAEVVRQLDQVGPVELVIAVSFLNETDTLAHVVTTVSRGLREFWPDHRAVILCAGSPRGKQGLETVNRLGPDPTPRKAFLLPDRRLDGKGWAVRATLEVAGALGASLALLLEADLLTVSRDGETEGLTTEWVRDLLAPILDGHAQVVLGRFCSDSPGSHVGDHPAHPLLAALHNLRLESSLPREDVLAALVPLFQARLATFARELTAAGDPGNLARFAREALLEAEVDEFLRAKPEFLERWKQKGEAVQPYLPEVSSWETTPSSFTTAPPTPSSAPPRPRWGTSCPPRCAS